MEIPRRVDIAEENRDSVEAASGGSEGIDAIVGLLRRSTFLFPARRLDPHRRRRRRRRARACEPREVKGNSNFRRITAWMTSFGGMGGSDGIDRNLSISVTVMPARC